LLALVEYRRLLSYGNGFAMAWRKSPPQLVAMFESVVPYMPGVVAKPMFGYPACFVNGHMFMGLHQEDMIVRLSEADRKDALAIGGTRIFEPMPGRPMKEYVALAPQLLEDRDQVRAWVAKAVAYGNALPGKAPKKTAGASGKSKTEKRGAR
jgi:TfoX/Sxy family transcriptional regulator of competence genes